MMYQFAINNGLTGKRPIPVCVEGVGQVVSNLSYLNLEQVRTMTFTIRIKS